MKKIKIKINIYGCLPFSIDLNKIKKFKSSVFEVIGIDEFPLPEYQSGVDYATIHDNVWKKTIKKDGKEDLVFSITNAYLENSFYSRRLSDKRVIFSFGEIRSYLEERYIPLENVILKELYMYSLYLKTDKYNEIADICHNETKGCLYDMDGILSDVAETFYAPKLCRRCEEKLSKKGLPENIISEVKEELKKLKPIRLYKFLLFIKKYLLWSLIFTFMLSVLAGLLASMIYEAIK